MKNTLFTLCTSIFLLFSTMATAESVIQERSIDIIETVDKENAILDAEEVFEESQPVIQEEDLPEPVGPYKPRETAPITEEEKAKYTRKILLQGLNKVTARISSLETTINKPITFGTLEIIPHKCWKSAPEELPENKALIEILEQKPGEEKHRIFYGWMFSSSPALSALEHPVYDVTVLECKA